MEVHLKNIRIYAYHGIHNGEEIIGNEFEINLTVSFPLQQNNTLTIHDTVNYATLYKIVKDKMAIKKDLLEQVACDIANEIMAGFLLIESVEISIYKSHPPIEKFEGSVGVTHRLQR